MKKLMWFILLQLNRCIDTIKLLAEKKWIEIKIEENLIEINSPDLQDKEFSCKNFKWENVYGGGETIKEVYDRVVKTYKKIIEENKWKTVVIVSHWDPTVLIRKYIRDFDYNTEKYTSGVYLENNPQKYPIDRMYGIEYVYSKTAKEVDLHKHFVDEILVKDPETWKTCKKIPELLDVWFDSGSMPYALAHIMSSRKGISSGKFFEQMDKLIELVEKTDESFDYRNIEDLLNK